MNLTRTTRAIRTSRGPGFGPLLLMAAFSVAGCAPEGEGADESGEMAESGAMAEADTRTVGAAQDAPACQFRAERDELAQRASAPDSSTIRLGDGVAKLCYGAPSARDREVMGGLVPYGQPWRLGADEPTTLHLTVPAQIGDVRVDPGAYSLYAVPGESEWTIVVNGATQRWGIPINDQVRAEDIGSFTVAPESTDHVERMTIELSSAGEGAAEMSVAWERTRLSFTIRAMGG